MRFFNLGIFKISPESVDTNTDSIRRVKVELYCERMEFGLQPPAPA